MCDVQTSRRAAAFLARLFQLLEPDAVLRLTVGALLGKELDLDPAVAVTGRWAFPWAPAVALAHYRIAERATGELAAAGGDASLEVRIAEGLGDVLTLKGEYAEASSRFSHALSHCPDSVGRAVLDGKLGDVAFKTGDQALARRHLERALRDLGGRVPGRGGGMAAAAVKEAVVQALHTVAPRLFLA